MAIYHFSAKVIGRSAGRSAVASAAYRAAERLHDELLNRDHDFTAKVGVEHREIMLPDDAPSRWLDRQTLWNEVEAGEKRKDAQLARDIEFSLPRELGKAEAIKLAQDFVREQFVARGMVADLNVHWTKARDGEEQPHAHVMLTMREVVAGPSGLTGEGTFGKKVVAWNDRGLLREWRERWAEVANARLSELGHDVRIDHRSYADQGIELEPQNKIGPAGARRAERGEQDAERAAEHDGIARRNGERIAADPLVALDALTRQHSTFTRQDLARFVNRQTADGEQFARVMAKVEASPELVRLGEDGRGRQRLTTRDMLAAERRMERAALALSGSTTHAVALERRQAALDGAGLGPEQHLAFGHVTRARDLVAVVGYAGTGKSTMLGVAREAWESQGYRVRGAALSGIAAEGLEGGSGIESRTLASLEWGWKEGRDLLTPRDVLVVDEAGMVGSRQMERVLSHAREAGAKVVLVGDPEQLQAIEAGAAFRAIVERVGAVEITAIRRQRTEWQRDATRELATDRTGSALERYEAAGMVQGHGTQAEARVALVAGWDVERRAAPEQSRVILAYTRRDVEALNMLARERLATAGELGRDHLVATERGTRVMAAGDRLMFLRNERGLGAGPKGQGGVAVKNGSLGTVLAVEAQGERLTVALDGAGGGGGKTGQEGRDTRPVVTFYTRDYGHVDHGYAATIHKAQGVTVDRAHVLAGEHMDRHAAYVALTRHRDGVALHWSSEELGDRAGLTRTLGRERAKDTSLDYGLAPEPEYAEPYAARRGVVPAREVAQGAGPAGVRLGARTALLLNRVGAMQAGGTAALQRHAEQVAEREAQGEAVPGLQPRFARARARQALDTALAASVRLVERGSASMERMAEMVARLPEALRQVAERAQEMAGLRKVASAGVAGWRERYEAGKRQAAMAAARDAQARDLVERWGGLIQAYNKALPGLGRDPELGGTRAALIRFGQKLRRHPEAVQALRDRPEEFGMDARPNLARVLAARSPERAVAAQLDRSEVEQRAHLQQAAQEASRRAQEAARARQSFGPSMG